MEMVVVYARPVNLPMDAVLLIQKDRPDYLRNTWNLPGGKIEPGESIIDAAVRELAEETGLEPLVDPEMNPTMARVMGRVEGSRNTIHAVLVNVDGDEVLRPRTGETETPAWYSWPQVLSLPMLMPNLRLVMPLIRNNMSGWLVEDRNSDWRTAVQHEVILQLAGAEPMKVMVKGMKYFATEEEQ